MRSLFALFPHIIQALKQRTDSAVIFVVPDRGSMQKQLFVLLQLGFYHLQAVLSTWSLPNGAHMRAWTTLATAGKMTHVMSVPREQFPATQTGCPWMETTIAWIPPSDSAADYTLPTNSKVLININSTVGHVVIPATSELIFANLDIELRAKSISVLGKLRIGSATCRTTRKAIVTLTGSPSDVNSSDMLHKGIVVSEMGSLELYGALGQPTWTRLANTAAAGDSTIYLQECVEWQADETVLLTTTHVEDHRRHNKNEKATIAAVRTINLTLCTIKLTLLTSTRDLCVHHRLIA